MKFKEGDYECQCETCSKKIFHTDACKIYDIGDDIDSVIIYLLCPSELEGSLEYKDSVTAALKAYSGIKNKTIQIPRDSNNDEIAAFIGELSVKGLLKQWDINMVVCGYGGE